MLLSGVWTIPALATDATYTFTTLAGTSATLVNSAEGTGSDAQFSAPRGVAVDSAGNLYVADSSNHTIRKITALGVVTTLSGTAGSTGNVSVTPARFSEPFGVAVDSAGNVYVADTNNNAIRKITPAGTVTTVAGGNGMGTTDGAGSVAQFSEPHGVALDSGGNIYVTDFMNHTVRKITPAGVVSTLAGGAGQEGFVNGTGTAARFKSLQGIAVDSAGNIYVADAGNRSIRKVTAGGLVTTLFDGSDGQFGQPYGVAVDAAGNVYVADYGSNVIKKVTAAGVISNFAGTSPVAGSSDGTTGALFNYPSGIAVDTANNVYVTDVANNTVRKISASGTVSTLAGLAGRSSSVDGKGTAARFEDPYAVAADGAGNVFVADATDHSIRKITADGTVTTIAGKPGTFGSTDGSGTAALFKGPQGIAVDTAGNVYVADTGNKIVRKISATGVVTTFAGSAGQGGKTDGTGTAARLSSPYGIAVDSAGNVYVVDSNDNTLRKITSAGVVTTLAGSPGESGLIDGTGAVARFSVPQDVAVDSAGNIYVCDHGNHAIRKITPAGVVTTLAGSGQPGLTNGNGRSAAFKFPAGIAVDSSANVYVADTDNQVIRKITPTGDVTTIAGSRIGSTDDVGTAASFYNPKDVTVDPSGNLYVADRGNHTIRKGTLGAATTTVGSTTSTPEQVTADCVFDWAEGNLKDYFSPAVKSTTSEPFYYRLYSGKQTAIGVASGNLHVYASGQLTNLGPISNFLTMSGCK